MEYVLYKRIVMFLLMASAACFSFSQTPMQNVLGRDCQSLNGKWSILTDVMNSGKKMG